MRARLLGHALDPHHRPRLAPRELAELLPLDALARGREAVVDEEQLGSRRTQQRRCVLGRILRQPVLVDGFLCGLAAEERGELPHGAPVGEAGGDVRPLARVGALGEETAELVEARPLAQDPVRVVVDEPDAVQYFEKWPCCSNASSPAE